MKPLGADFIYYEVSDLKKSVEFYRDVLGLRLLSMEEKYHWAEFDVPPTTLALYAPLGMLKRPPQTGGAGIAIAVPSVEEAVEELKSKGVQVDFGPFETEVCHMAFFRDPDGNSVGLHHRKDGTVG